ncbi:UDP-N-acetylmuramate--L-alanine ligase [Nautilia lithotrophica]
MKIHFVGIGGIGLSGLARYMKAKGHIISGSDIADTKLTKQLKSEGININIPHYAESIKDQDIIVHTAVAKPDNPELLEAKKRGIKTLSRREFLPFVVNDKKVLAVCGAHGKSTTSAILASILPNTNAIIGAESKDFGSNMRYTGSEYLVFEADESDGSFIDSNPYIAVVTNTEPEHMEYYDHDLERFYGHYEIFLKKAHIRIANGDDEFIKKLSFPVKKVSVKEAKNIRYELIENKPKTVFEYKGYDFEVYGFGEHLVIDAILAIEAASELISFEEIQQNIKNYQGIKKRFDILQKSDDFILIDDYGHHPTEIKATLHSARIFAKLNGIDKVTAIWQPHKYSRTIDNLDAFIECFNEADELVILPVWEAGEEPVDIDFPGLFAKYNPIFANRLKADSNIIMLTNEDGKTIKEIKEGLVIGFGAGDITYQLRGVI